MTRRVPCPAAPGPLEGYAARFDDLFHSLAQRRGFREYLAGLLAPRDRNKTLTALAGAEPVTGAQHPAVQRLQFFLSEARWDHEQVNARRLELLLADPATGPHEGGVLVIDDSGDRKEGTKTAHVGHQWLGRDARVHDARHTAATLLIEQGVHIRVVQEVLGHTRVTTTERYTHVATLQMKDASERMGQALWGQG
jgi:SRSO17 transposase